jgi:hypothetical protein
MMKAIIYKKDGQTYICHPVINTHTLVSGKVVERGESITEEQALQRALSRLPEGAVVARIVDKSEIPEDREAREIWRAQQ